VEIAELFKLPYILKNVAITVLKKTKSFVLGWKIFFSYYFGF